VRLNFEMPPTEQVCGISSPDDRVMLQVCGISSPEDRVMYASMPELFLVDAVPVLVVPVDEVVVDVGDVVLVDCVLEPPTGASIVFPPKRASYIIVG